MAIPEPVTTEEFVDRFWEFARKRPHGKWQGGALENMCADLMTIAELGEFPEEIMAEMISELLGDEPIEIVVRI